MGEIKQDMLLSSPGVPFSWRRASTQPTHMIYAMSTKSIRRRKITGRLRVISVLDPHSRTAINKQQVSDTPDSGKGFNDIRLFQEGSMDISPSDLYKRRALHGASKCANAVSIAKY